MHPLALLEKPTKMFFHYKMMFSYITIPNCVRMLRLVNQNISLHYNSSTLPRPTFITFRLCVGAFMATISSLIIMFHRKLLATFLAGKFWKTIRIFKSWVNSFECIPTHKNLFTFKGASNSLFVSRFVQWGLLPANDTERSGVRIISNSCLSCQLLMALKRASLSFPRKSWGYFLSTYLTVNHTIIIPYRTNYFKGVIL